MTIVLYLILSPLLLALALIFKKFEPKNINMSYGYRTKRSMANEEAWRVGNAFAANLLLYIALALNVLQAICFLIWPSELSFLMVAGFMVIAIIAIIPVTESHLRKHLEGDT